MVLLFLILFIVVYQLPTIKILGISNCLYSMKIEFFTYQWINKIIRKNYISLYYFDFLGNAMNCR